MPGELIKKEDGAIEYNDNQIQLIKNTVARGATNDELSMFLHVAKRTGLDPIMKRIYFIKRRVWSKQKNNWDEVATIQTGIDGYREMAARTGEHAGTDDAIHEETGSGYPKSAKVIVYRKVQGEKCAFAATARWDEYAPMKDGKPTGMWDKMPYLMLAKCAESLALRKAFPEVLSGVYTNEEMMQAAEPISYQESDPGALQGSTLPPTSDGKGDIETIRDMAQKLPDEDSRNTLRARMEKSGRYSEDDLNRVFGK